jgi:hypothetical protein
MVGDGQMDVDEDLAWDSRDAGRQIFRWRSDDDPWRLTRLRSSGSAKTSPTIKERSCQTIDVEKGSNIHARTKFIAGTRFTDCWRRFLRKNWSRNTGLDLDGDGGMAAPRVPTAGITGARRHRAAAPGKQITRRRPLRRLDGLQFPSFISGQAWLCQKQQCRPAIARSGREVIAAAMVMLLGLGSVHCRRDPAGRQEQPKTRPPEDAAAGAKARLPPDVTQQRKKDINH